MDIRVLRYFLTVSREESITKAADTLHMTQPPLSRQLKDLEKELGKTLFVRGSKKITLTEDGILLKKRAEEIVDLMDKTKAELSSQEENINGEIYIGSGETDAVSILADTAMKLKEKHPDINYHIYSGDSSYIMEKLDKGLIDFALLIGNVDIENYNYIKLKAKDTWGVLMRKDSPLSEKEHITPKDLKDKPIMVSQQSYDNSEMVNWLGSRHNVVLKYDLIYNASHFVEKGFGYAIVLDKLISTDGDKPLCFRPLYPPMEAEIHLVWKKHQVFSKASKLFLENIRKLNS